MFMKSLLLSALLGSLFGVVAAQDPSSTDNAPAAPTSTAGIPACVLTCTTQAAASSGCVSITNVTCVCTSTPFETAALSCLTANCTSSDLAAAQALQSSLCGASASSGAGSSTGSGSGSNSPTSGAPSPSATSPTTANSTGGSGASTSAASSGGAATPASAALINKPAFSSGILGLGALAVSLVGVLVGTAITF